MTNSKSDNLPPPIFILGVLPRSGTNFLYDLLLLHPDCYPSLVAEDYFTAYADLLLKYGATVNKHWKPNWRVKQFVDQPELLVAQYLGLGLISFLALKPDTEIVSEDKRLTLVNLPQKRFVTKTPSVKNLKYFFKIFPDAHLVIIIRDGRAVVESGVKSFQWNYEKMTRVWADSARTILKFEQEMHDTKHKFLIVRYEDVYQEPEVHLKKILLFLGLNPDCYNFENADNLPIRGSSELRKQSKQDLHWKPIEKTADFNPTTRWHHWSRTKQERFKWLAGKYLVAFGYCQPDELKSIIFWQIWNIILDIKWGIQTTFFESARFCWRLLKRIKQKPNS
ncbi:MAG: sulfotransferase [Anaerolineae bacterium]|nr:sulfotransferase [Anaerolineae bacterium]